MGELYRDITDFQNLYNSFKKAFKGKKKNPEAARFHLDLEKNLFKLKEELLTHRYTPGKYRYFKIRDPKERVISEAPFPDRVVHHAFVGVIEPLFEKIFIPGSYACRKGKGTHKAVLQARHYIKSNTFYLKMDIEKYFETMDHRKLVDIFSETIRDPEVLRLLKTILKTSEQSSGIKGKGIPIGNLTSQFFANVYLNKLDHYVLDELAFPYYIRYMDDFALFDNDKNKLKTCRDQLTEFVEGELRLKVKERATIIQSRENGIGFLGYRVFPGLIRVKNKNIRRLKRKTAAREKQLNCGVIDEGQLTASVQSIVGYLGFARSTRLRRRMFRDGR
ncbi:MAG: RNA-directed DNA polymerase (Reverse transcriptase) [bacterium]|nr:RNA-directed DNA polymerase (Reverse transcriptase) [bacterium]